MEKYLNNHLPCEFDKPDMQRKATLMQALQHRKSSRSFTNDALTKEDMADLLWAAKGINRPDTEGLTAGNSLNKQEIDVYVCSKEGAWLYNAHHHALTLITTTNLMPALAGGQEYVLNAPLVLLIVGDVSVFTGNFAPMAHTLACLDAGIVSQNIYLFCAGNNLNTIARITMQQDMLRLHLKLKDSQCLLMNHPVGYSNPEQSS